MPKRTFQTSFIPRGNLTGGAPVGATKRRRTINVLLGVALISFVASVVGYGGAILYRGVSRTTIGTLGVSLERAREAFDPNLLFEFDRLDRKIEAAKVLLSNHITLQPLFAVFEQSTLKSVQLNSFAYRFDNVGEARIEIAGRARSFVSVALQSDAFVETKRLRNVVFSDLQITQTGGVNFRVVAEVDPALLSYRRNVAVSK